MLFRGKSIQEINENDLYDLIGNEQEGKFVDFKESAYPSPPENQLPTDQRERDRVKNQWKIDLCTDIVAFANASGGWIICGMKERGGIATELCGLGAEVNGEGERLRLGQCAQSGIEPPISGLEVEVVSMEDTAKSKMLVIHIPRSYRAPHRIKATSKFYIRRSANDEMNMDELRAAFSLSENLENRIKAFRKERADILASDEAHEEIPVMLSPGVRLVLHVIPLSFADTGQIVDLSTFQSTSNPAQWILKHNLHHGRFNLEGYVRPNGIERDGSHQLEGYTQIYRNGVVEAVDTIYAKDQLIYLPSIEQASLRLLERSLVIEENLGVYAPLVLMISLLGVKNHKFTITNESSLYPQDPSLPINRYKLLIPDIVIENYEPDHKSLIRPIFDMLWNVGGWERSFSYDENGVWKRDR